jgi:hypothetical protein
VRARRSSLAYVALAVAPLLASALHAQALPIGSVTGYTGVEARGLSFQSGLGVKSITEVAVPFVVVWPTSPSLSFDLGGRYATVSYAPEAGATSTLSGLTDIQARGVYQLVPDIAVLTVAVNLPTGKAQLDSTELPVAGAIASDMIPFPVANFASGFNVTSGLALAVPVAGWAVGAAGSYRVNGTFTPLADTTACPVSGGKASCGYKPGGEFRLRVGADRIVGQSRLSLGFTVSSFGEDQYGSSPIFQSGTRYIGEGSWTFPIGNVGLSLYAWDLYRSPGTEPVAGTTTVKRNVVTGGVAGAFQLGASVLRPFLEFRNQALGSLSTAGRMFSLGARYQMPLGENYTIVPLLRLDTGHVVNQVTNQSVTFTGWDVGVTLRATM